MKTKKNNKGFTLVELIVVLVILAILAAILVPALLGYIDRAKGQQIVLNARSCYTAAQAEFSSLYGKGDPASDIATGTHPQSILTTADVPTGTNGCTGLIIGADAYVPTTAQKDQHGAYTVKYVAYTENGQTIYFDGSAWVDADPGIGSLTPYTIK